MNGVVQSSLLSPLEAVRARFIVQVSIPFAYISRGVVYKQTNAALFSESAFVFASVAAHLPLTAVSDVLFATPLYFIAQYDEDGGRWLFFCLVVILQDLVSSALYKAMTYASPSEETAMIGSGGWSDVEVSACVLDQWSTWTSHLRKRRYFCCRCAVAWELLCDKHTNRLVASLGGVWLAILLVSSTLLVVLDPHNRQWAIELPPSNATGLKRQL